MKIEIETQYDNPELPNTLSEIVKFYAIMTIGKASMKVDGKVEGDWDYTM